MNELFLIPDDVLFFRDGRPMTGSLSGHGARLPEPHVLNGALHAACHRAFAGEQEAGHLHRSRRRSSPKPADTRREEKFGALTSAGPFPVKRFGGSSSWYFPTPADITRENWQPGMLPVRREDFLGESSLEKKLWPLANLCPPSKTAVPGWLSKSAFEHYLRGESGADGFLETSDIFAAEATMGIGIDPGTGATLDGAFFTKSQVRLRRDFGLGAYARLPRDRNGDGDLVAELFPEAGRITLGGESRICSVDRRIAETIALPRGPEISGKFVKWVLLTPAIFPYLPAGNGRLKPHPGGWLPSWVNEDTYRVELLTGPGKRKAERLRRRGVEATPGEPVDAKLVAARIPGSLTVTGWAFGREERDAGARSTLLAVPAGAIFYFEAPEETEARKLAEALNWHGSWSATAGRNIVNRRSALMGEKGYGIGVCGSWTPLKPGKTVH